MKLIENWRKAYKLLSVKLALLSALLGSVEVAYSMWATGTTPVIALGAAVVSIGAAVGRIIAQPGVLDG